MITSGHDTGKFIFAMFQLLYHSLHQAKKSVDGDCKLAVETLQDSNLSSKSVSKTRSHCFHFPNSNISVIPYTHVPTGKTFGLTASIVLFPDPLETTASTPHTILIVSTV